MDLEHLLFLSLFGLVGCCFPLVLKRHIISFLYLVFRSSEGAKPLPRDSPSRVGSAAVSRGVGGKVGKEGVRRSKRGLSDPRPKGRIGVSVTTPSPQDACGDQRSGEGSP